MTKAVVNHLSPVSVSGQCSVSLLNNSDWYEPRYARVGEARAVYTTHSPRHVICHSLIANRRQSLKLPVEIAV